MVPARSDSLGRAAGGRIGVPILLAAAWLVAEAAMLRWRFSTDGLASREESWAFLLRLGRFNVPLALGMLGGAALAIGPRRLARARAALQRDERAPLALGSVLLHAVLFAAFWRATAVLLEEHPTGWSGWLLAAAWPLAGGGALAALAAAVVGWRALADVARIVAVRGLAGAAAGVAAVALGARIADGWYLAEPLTRATLLFAHGVTSLFLSDVRLDPAADVLGTPGFPVHVTRYCSGYEGIGLFVVFFVVFLGIARDRLRFPRVLWLLPLGAALAWLLNGLRISALIVIGARWSPDVAMGGFHTHAGWPLVCATALGAAALAVRSPWFAARGAAPRERATANPTVPWILPFVAAIATTLVLGALIAVPEQITPLGALAGAAIAWRYRRVFGPAATLLAPRALLLGAAGAVVWWITGSLGSRPEDAAAPLAWQATLSTGWLAAWWTIRLFAAIVANPWIEELAFRGYGTRVLVSADFERVPLGAMTLLSASVSSLAFGALHENVLGGVLCGALYCLALRSRGRLGDAVVAHGATNALLFLGAAATGRWDLVL